MIWGAASCTREYENEQLNSESDWGLALATEAGLELQAISRDAASLWHTVPIRTPGPR